MGKFGNNEKKNYSLKHCKAILVLWHMSLAVYKDKLKKVNDSKAMSTRFYVSVSGYQLTSAKYIASCWGKLYHVTGL